MYQNLKVLKGVPTSSSTGTIYSPILPKPVCYLSTKYLAQPLPLHHDAQTNSETTRMRSYDSRLILGLPKPGSFVVGSAKLIYSILLPKQFTPSLSHFPYSLSLLLYSYLSRYYTMVFARRSIFRAATAAQSFRAAPVARQSAQILGRRFNSTSGSYHPGHKTSDLPW